MATQQKLEGKMEYELCDRIQAVERSVKVAGSIFWRLFRVGEAEVEYKWHAYIVVYCNLDRVIVGPEYEGPIGVRRVGNLLE